MPSHLTSALATAMPACADLWASSPALVLALIIGARVACWRLGWF